MPACKIDDNSLTRLELVINDATTRSQYECLALQLFNDVSCAPIIASVANNSFTQEELSGISVNGNSNTLKVLSKQFSVDIIVVSDDGIYYYFHTIERMYNLFQIIYLIIYTFRIQAHLYFVC